MPVNLTCQDRDRILRDGSPAEWNALELHTAQCSACAEEVRAWKALSAAAQELRDYKHNPSLWPRIERTLSAHQEQREGRWNWTSFGFSWQTAAASALALLLLVGGAWFYAKRPGLPLTPQKAGPLLKSKALAQVERTEKAYFRAIEQLAVEAQLQLGNPRTPLLVSYREKLLILDSAIDDLRAQASQNPSNVHLRYQLLAMYQEKQHTLQDVLEAKP
jgi:hypothetical protein